MSNYAENKKIYFDYEICRNSIIKLFVHVGILLIFFSSHQVVQAETETINNFNVNIAIQKDGAVFVTENIIYNFGSNEKHGIFRDIPLTAVNGPKLNIKVSSVSNEVGQLYSSIASVTNNILRIKIGDPNVLVSGIKTYVISYQVFNATRTFNDRDELYWNVTGNQWPVAIQNVNASVTLPDFSISNVKMDCFTGPQGSTKKKCIFNQSGSNINYSTTRLLKANEGLTFVLGIPLGYIHNAYVLPQQNYPVDNALNSNTNTGIFTGYFTGFFKLGLPEMIVIILASTPFIIIFFGQRAALAMPKPIIPSELEKKPVVIEYTPPDNLLPIEMGTLLARKASIVYIPLVVLDLAVRGYIKIRYVVQEIKFLPDKKDFELIKLKDGSGLVHPADKAIFQFLFSDQDTVKLSDIKKQKNIFKLNIKKIQNATEKYLYNKEYFDKVAGDKLEKHAIYFPFFVVPILFLVSMPIYKFIVFFLSDPGFLRSVFIVLFIVFIIFVCRAINRFFVQRLTPQGISTLVKILGFRKFLQLTKKDKLQFLNIPELRSEMFEKFLPYAMVFGVENEWAQKFEGTYSTVPSWYENSTTTNFNSYVLVHNLTLFNKFFNKVFSGTSSRSGGRSGGGGSSGGGSGGGGGGSW